MARPKTKNLEVYYFNQFLNCISIPEGKIEYGDKPDMTVSDSNSNRVLLGIEQTRFYIESGESTSSEQIQSKRREEVLEKAEEEYKKTIFQNLRLSISFNQKSPIHSVDQLAKKLVSLSKKIAPTFYGQLPKHSFKFIPEIEFVYVQWDIEATWQITQVYTSKLVSKDRLQALVSEKDRKSNSYRSCAELWLLVIIDFFDSAQDQDIDDKILTLESNNFTKVILFKTVLNQVKEIVCIKNVKKN